MIGQLVRVRVPAVWYGGRDPADFKLGLGPCGKVVTRLSVNYLTQGFVSVIQTHEDETHKIFRYRIVDLNGRIEEEYN